MVAEKAAEKAVELLISALGGGVEYKFEWYPHVSWDGLRDPMPWILSIFLGCAAALTVHPKSLSGQKATFFMGLVVFAGSIGLQAYFMSVRAPTYTQDVFVLLASAAMFFALTLVIGLIPGQYRRWRNSHG